MKKIHTVTKDMAHKLHEGDTFKNFGELFRMLVCSNGQDPKTIKVIGGDSKIQFLADLDRFVEFEKNGYVFTIVKIRAEEDIKPARPAPGTSKFTLMLENLIAYQLIQECERQQEQSIELFWSPYNIFFSCGMTNGEFVGYSSRFSEIDSEMEAKAKLFRFNAKAVMEEYVKAAFRAMARNEEVIWKKEQIVFIRTNPRDVCVPDKEMAEKYLKMVTRVIESFDTIYGTPCESEKDIFLSGKSDEFYEKLRSTFKKEFEYDAVYPMYHIITEPTSLRRAMKRIARVSPAEEFLKMNNAMCVNILKLASIHRGRMMSILNPDYENSIWGEQPKYLYKQETIDNDLIDMFVEDTIRTNIPILCDDDVPNATFDKRIKKDNNPLAIS